MNQAINNLNRSFYNSNRWLTLASDQPHQTMTFDLLSRCSKNQQQKRWILCVGGDETDLQPLTKHIDHEKLLRVYPNLKPITFEQIVNALLRGNCSTIIIWDKQFNASQLDILKSSAKHGKTECIIVNHHKTLH
ncbi:hypothetical protein QWY77_00390 [Thalassotalea ponticola]|uniref:hypothetical protein n=1 Tax=Thalassotalea ponticola TaxID=1523392 RepID=UPI0025B3D69C|nr:hypothetical protein [Thalassotalea ponticola]MDN3651241.1 hypothetical protein [Thalassotalea ponticola]